MKATGIVRRIDDLGRVVIPKEIRRTLRIREGDPLEIFTDSDGEIILKKYSPIGELGAFAKEYAESLAQTIGHVTCIVDKDQIIAVSLEVLRKIFMKNISVKPWKIVSTPEAPMSLTETTAISFLYLKTMTLPKYPIIISSSHLSYVKETLWGQSYSSLPTKKWEK